MSCRSLIRESKRVMCMWALAPGFCFDTTDASQRACSWHVVRRQVGVVPGGAHTLWTCVRTSLLPHLHDGSGPFISCGWFIFSHVPVMRLRRRRHLPSGHAEGCIMHILRSTQNFNVHAARVATDGSACLVKRVGQVSCVHDLAGPRSRRTGQTCGVGRNVDTKLC